MTTVMSPGFLDQAKKSLTTPGGLDVALLDQVVAVMNGAPGDDQKKALEILTQLKDSPDAWTSVDFILEKSALMQTKYFALQILEATVRSKWKSLPRVQCEGIKGFIISNILEISSDREKYEQMKLYIQKLNLVLVQIVKQEWPNHWTTFMQDIVGSSRSNESLCMNNLTILRLLSEEVFEFEQDLTSAKGHRLKQKFCGEFEAVFRLCHAVLESSESASLIDNTLRTLHRFLSWIPVGYIFETNLITLLTTKFLPFPVFRSVTVQCLTEIASIDITDKNPEYRTVLVDLLLKAIGVLSEQISPDVDMNASYHNGSDEDQKFVANLAQFLATYMKVHHKGVEVLRDNGSDHRNTDIKRAHQISLEYLLKISEVEDVEVFKICLEYWNWLTTELYRENPFPTSAPLLISAAFMTSGMPDVPRRNLYNETMSRLRTIMISRMAKPEEVLVVENDSGEVVRELIKDTDSINLYKTMRETLVYLTHLDTKDTEAKMTEKLQNQVNGSEWSWKNLNTLCWAVGSISGSMHTEDEKRFLVTVIRDLLGLCEQKRGKDNKAVIASNIMYVVGQYPRFLREHWKFLKTVINKLFEFMHESHEGVQDMACDTFIKIATKCKRHFVITQVGETQPFVDDMLQNLSGIICDLSPPQVHVFYEAVGHIIQAQNETVAQEALIERLMTLPNSIWDEIITHVANDTGVLRDEDVVKNIVNLLKTNVAACRSIGHPFFYQLSKILIDMLNVYKVISENMSAAVAEHGEGVLKQNIIKQMRAAKKEMLVLLTVWISKCTDANMTMEVMEPLFDAVLFDYARNTAMAREPNVLSLLSTMVTALKDRISPQIPRILDAVFKATLEMIDKELTAYPEHRLNLFVLLRDIAQHCFAVLIAIPDTDFRLLLEADVWALQHQMRDVAEVGIEILKEVLVKVSDLDLQIRQGFYTQHFMYLLEQTLAIATDRNQVQIVGLTNLSDVLCHLFTAVEKHMPGPLNGKPEGQSNADYIFNWLSALLSQHFSQNLNADQIRVTAKGFFSFNNNVAKMRDHLRDFLIQLREETGEDTSDLYIEEKEAEIQTALNQKMAVPGIKNPNEIDDEDMK